METEIENDNSQNVEPETTDSSNSEPEAVEPEAPERVEGETKDEFTEREKQYYARIKKLEADLKKARETAPTAVNVEGLSQTDLIFIAKADIHEDDISDVLRWAKNDGLTVKDAYASYKPILDTRAQERQTALATETRSPRGKKPESGAALIEKASRGELKPTEQNIRDLAKARFEMRKQQSRK